VNLLIVQADLPERCSISILAEAAINNIYWSVVPAKKYLPERRSGTFQHHYTPDSGELLLLLLCWYTIMHAVGDVIGVQRLLVWWRAFLSINIRNSSASMLLPSRAEFLKTVKMKSDCTTLFSPATLPPVSRSVINIGCLKVDGGLYSYHAGIDIAPASTFSQKNFKSPRMVNWSWKD